MVKIVISESSIDLVVNINSKIREFNEWDNSFDKLYFENRYKWKDKLILVWYYESIPAWYVIWYDKYWDWSFYCWMAWVLSEFRRKWVLTLLMDYFENRVKSKWYNKIRLKTRNNRRWMLWYLIKNDYNVIELTQMDNVDYSF